MLVLSSGRACVLFADIETSRVEAEERFEELGFESLPYPWHEGPGELLADLVAGTRQAGDREIEGALAPHRRELLDPERERFFTAGRDAAEAMVATLARLRPETRELEAGAELARQARSRGFFPGVVLVAGAERQRLHRHPLPTEAPLGPHALLAVTAEREGLYLSLTRLASFGPPPAELERLVRAAATVDAAMLAASRPGAAVRDVLATAAREYEAQGFPEEWRRHHQGGITGYRGREVFATPADPTPLPSSCAVAWNPSIRGGAKSEDTALVSDRGVEIVTATPGLPQLSVNGLPRPGIAEL